MLVRVFYMYVLLKMLIKVRNYHLEQRNKLTYILTLSKQLKKLNIHNNSGKNDKCGRVYVLTAGVGEWPIAGAKMIFLACFLSTNMGRGRNCHSKSKLCVHVANSVTLAFVVVNTSKGRIVQTMNRYQFCTITISAMNKNWPSKWKKNFKHQKKCSNVLGLENVGLSLVEPKFPD